MKLHRGLVTFCQSTRKKQLFSFFFLKRCRPRSLSRKASSNCMQQVAKSGACSGSRNAARCTSWAFSLVFFRSFSNFPRTSSWFLLRGPVFIEPLFGWRKLATLTHFFFSRATTEPTCFSKFLRPGEKKQLGRDYILRAGKGAREWLLFDLSIESIVFALPKKVPFTQLCALISVGLAFYDAPPKYVHLFGISLMGFSTWMKASLGSWLLIYK